MHCRFAFCHCPHLQVSKCMCVFVCVCVFVCLFVFVCANFCVDVCCRVVKFSKKSTMQNRTFPVGWRMSLFFSMILTFIFKVKLLTFYFICEYLVNGERWGKHYYCCPIEVAFGLLIGTFTSDLGRYLRSRSSWKEFYVPNGDGFNMNYIK